MVANLLLYGNRLKYYNSSVTILKYEIFKTIRENG